MLTLLTFLACASEPEPLPTQASAAAADQAMQAAGRPPMVQLIYDYAFLPRVQDSEQRVRIAIWLKHMELSAYQLRALIEAHGAAELERQRVERAQREIVAGYEPELAAAYDAMWQQLQAGADIEDPALLAAAEPLSRARIHKEQERELLALRVQGVKSVLAAEDPFLRSLTPEQEARLTDSLVFMRHRLDPIANPGDFKALVGSTFTPGDYATLTRGSFRPEDQQMDLAGLWSAEREPGVPVFADARRELLVYMILLEPTLPEAAGMLLELAEAEEAAGPTPGVPVEPPPGDPGAPPPGEPGAPTPAPPGEPTPVAPTEPAPGTPTPPEPR